MAAVIKRLQTLAAQSGSNVWLATALSYIDRAAAFACPLIVLKLLERPDAYVSIEFVISLSIILATFFDAGLRSFLLYDAKECGSANVAIHSAASAFKPLLLLHILGLLLTLGIGWEQNAQQMYLVGLAIARASALSITGLAFQWLILIGKPALGPIASIANWALSSFCLVLPPNASHIELTFFFFSGSFAVLVGATCLALRPTIPITGKRQTSSHLQQALAWGWPLLLSAAASMMVGNFSKLYAFSNLEKPEVLGFTFWMRAYSVVQLSHVAVVSTLTAQIYKVETPGLLHDNLARYLKFIGPPAILIMGLGTFGQAWVNSTPALSSAAAFVLFAYFFLWCVGAYIEIYLTRDAKNTTILIASLASSAIYIIGIAVIKPSSALLLATLMAISAAVYTALLLHSLLSR